MYPIPGDGVKVRLKQKRSSRSGGQGDVRYLRNCGEGQGNMEKRK